MKVPKLPGQRLERGYSRHGLSRGKSQGFHRAQPDSDARERARPGSHSKAFCILYFQPAGLEKEVDGTEQARRMSKRRISIALGDELCFIEQSD
jgi:hypothetical protein